MTAHKKKWLVQVNKKYIKNFERKMASFESDNAKSIDKFTGENFNLWKFKLEVKFVSVDLYGIVDKSEAIPPSNVDPKIQKEYQRHVKITMSIIALNLADNQFVHILSRKGPTKAWNTLYNIHERRVC